MQDAATWKKSPNTDADLEYEFAYRPEGWDKGFRFVGLRYNQREPDGEHPDQMGFFAELACKCRVFVTNLNDWSVFEVVEFYNKRAAVENLIKESNKDAGLTAHPSGIWAMNVNHFQFSMMAYNLNCWLALFQREETATVADLTHRTMATTRLRVLYLATRRAHGDHMRKPLPGAGIVRFADGKLRRIECKAHKCGPVVAIPLRA